MMEQQPADKPVLTARQYVDWAGYLLNQGSQFYTIREAFPELLPAVRRFDGSYVAMQAGMAVVFSFKVADGMGFAEIQAHLNAMLDVLRRPGSVGAVEYVGILALVFEKPLDPSKRDQLIEMRKRSWLRRGYAQIVIVELDAAALWTSSAPRTISPMFGCLSEALGKNGDPPPQRPAPALVGQRGHSAPPAYATLGLLIVLCAIHVAIALAPVSDTFLLRLYRFGGAHRAAIADGETWRFITAIFLHAGWDHLIGNLVFIYHFGRGLEPLFGGGWLMALFVFTGLGGSVLSAVFSSSSMSIGASGGALGLCGAFTAVYLFRKHRLTLRSRATFIFWFVIVMALSIYNGYTNPVIDNYGHIGGFLTGFALGSMLPFRDDNKEKWGGLWWGLGAACWSIWSATDLAPRWDPASVVYREVSDASLRVSFKRPENWYFWPTEKYGAAGYEMANALNGHISIFQGVERIDWILVPTVAREETLAEYYKKSGLETNVRSMENIEVNGAKVVRVLFSKTFSDTATGSEFAINGEDVFIPHQSGHVMARMWWPAQDSPYYEQIVKTVESSLATSEPPVEAATVP